jgi:hypothetical protein
MERAPNNPAYCKYNKLEALQQSVLAINAKSNQLKYNT